MPHTYDAIGVMSGTSLDGLDVAYCRFSLHKGKWTYDILAAETYPYSNDIRQTLENLPQQSALDFVTANIEFGQYIGQTVASFIAHFKAKPIFIASHGHTIFHQPQHGFSTQIGHGPAIAAITNLPVINDFRSADVALGGQGAPLVPIGDRLLFAEYHYCVNLGGIANISFEKEGKRIAFDVCGCNLLLNRLAEQLEKPYDDGGELAREGRLDSELLEELNDLYYFGAPFPKSLDKDWILRMHLPILNKHEARVRDKLNTYIHHIAEQLTRATKLSGVEKRGQPRMLITGGGAFNKYLVEELNLHNPKLDITVPDATLIAFKEALIFAFLGVLRWRGEANTLKSVTGAQRDSCGGALHLP